MTIASSPAPSISRPQASMFACALAIAGSCFPMWWVSAPQQPAPSATTTSTPRRVSRRMVAALIPGASTCWAQPASRATRPLRAPSARKTPGAVPPPAGSRAGASASIALSRRPSGWAAGSSPASARPAPAAASAARNRRG